MLLLSFLTLTFIWSKFGMFYDFLSEHVVIFNLYLIYELLVVIFLSASADIVITHCYTKW